MHDATAIPPPPKGEDDPRERRLAPLVGLAVGLVLVALVRRIGGSRVLAPDRAEEPAREPISSLPAEAHQVGRGRDAEHPAEIPPRGWWDIARRVYDEIEEDRILAVAGGVAFYGLLALFPAIGAFVALYGLVADPATIAGHLATLSDVMPGGAIEIIGGQVGRLTSKGGATLGIAFFTGLGVSLWSANAGMKAMFDALNVAYGEREKRNIILLNVWSLGFTFATLAFLVVAMSAIVVIPVVLKFVGLGAATEWIMWAGRWPALFLLTLAAITILYRYGPSRRHAQWVWLSPGAIFAAVGWLIVSMLFSWYVAGFGAYNETYGSLGAVIGFMTWMWLSSIIVLVGAEISAETEHQTACDSTTGSPRPMGRRGARMADTIGRAH
jgi:membrane protein